MLTFISLVAAGAMDEGTQGMGTFGMAVLVISKFYYIFRFPTHTLFFQYMHGKLFLIGLFFNSIFYALLTERIIAYFNFKTKR